MRNLRRNSSPAAASVLLQERKVGAGTRIQALVLKRGVTAPWLPNVWNLPGGMVDAGETALAAARRECEEEIGLTPVGLVPFAVWPGDGWTLEAFVATEWTGQIGVTWESDGYAWIDEGDLAHMRFVPGVREILKDVFRAAAG